MRKNHYYDSRTDGRRALLVDIDTATVRRSRLIIRDGRGQGALLLNRTYTTHAGARRALARRGASWTRYKTTVF